MSLIRTLCVFVIAGGLMAGCAGEYKAYEEAEAADTADAYSTFLEQYPDGVNSTSAKERLDMIHWEEAKAEDTAEGYEEYLRQHPTGKYVTRAEMEAPKKAWQAADLSNDAAQVQSFIDRYGSGAYGKKSNERLTLLQTWPQHLDIGETRFEVVEEGKRWKVSADVHNKGSVAAVETEFRIAWKNEDDLFARTKRWFLNVEAQEGVDAPPELTRPLAPGETRTFEFTFTTRDACKGWVQDAEHVQIDLTKLKLAG